MEQKIQIHQGQITIQLEGLEPKTVERYRANIHQLMTMGIFEIQNGKVILHFDNEKTLRKIDIEMTAWRK